MENQWIKEGEVKTQIDLSISDIQPVELEITSFLADDLIHDRSMMHKFRNMVNAKYPDREIKIIVK